MFGQNPKRAPVKGDGSFLEVKNIFKTIQGEGPFAGRPSIFIRLGGCNLDCIFCDTEFEDYDFWTLEQIIAKVQELRQNLQGSEVLRLAVITGGEPFRQPIEPLCRQLIELNFQVQIETNGTIFRPLPKGVDIICSPKAVKGRYRPVREDLLPHISAMKFLISPNILPYNSVAEIGQSKYNIPVYVQPIDQNDNDLNQQNIALTLKLSLEFGYYLSLQLHKILNIE